MRRDVAHSIGKLRDSIVFRARAWHPASDRTGNCRARHAKPVSSIAEVAGWSLSVSLLSTSLPRCPRNHACLPACPYVSVRYAQ